MLCPTEGGIGTSLRNAHIHKVMELERSVGYFAYIASPEPTYAKIYDDRLAYQALL